MAGQVSEQPIGRAVEQVLVQQHRDPDRYSQHALGDHAGRWRGRHYLGNDAALTGGTIATTPDNPTMSFDMDLQDCGLFRTADGREGELALRTATISAVQLTVLIGGRQLAVI